MASITASSAEAMHALLTEHLKYTPLTLIDDIINIVNEVLYRTMTAVEGGLLGSRPEFLGFKTPSDEADENGRPAAMQREIEEGVHSLETLLEATIDKTFDRLEIYVLRNILFVEEQYRPWVTLAHYKGLQHSDESATKIMREMASLRAHIQEAVKLNRALQAESRRNKILLVQLRSILTAPDGQKPSLAFMQNGGSEMDMGILKAARDQHFEPVQISTRAAARHLPALRSLLGSMHARGGDLQATRTSDAELERREYLDARVGQQLDKLGARAHHEGNARLRANSRAGGEDVSALATIAGLLDRNAKPERSSDHSRDPSVDHDEGMES